MTQNINQGITYPSCSSLTFWPLLTISSRLQLHLVETMFPLPVLPSSVSPIISQLPQCHPLSYVCLCSSPPPYLPTVSLSPGPSHQLCGLLWPPDMHNPDFFSRYKSGSQPGPWHLKAPLALRSHHPGRCAALPSSSSAAPSSSS